MSYSIKGKMLGALLISTAAGLGIMFVGTAEVQAANAPWCLYNKDGGAIECNYVTAEQCLFTARGQGGTCTVNSAYGYAQYSPYSPRPRYGFY